MTGILSVLTARKGRYLRLREGDLKEQRRLRMISEPILPLLIKTAIPTMIGMLVSIIYNLTDTFWIGRLNNKSMTAAIGIAYSFFSLMQAVGFWFGYGSGNVMSNRLGAKKEKEAQTVSSTGVVISIATGVAIMLCSYAFINPLVNALGGNVSADLSNYTTAYLKILIAAIPFLLYGVTLYNQMRLCGNVKDGMLGLASGMLLNIVLDPVFIIFLKMGIIGAGAATWIGEIVASAVLTVLSFKHGNIEVSLVRFKLSRENIYHILAGGAPNFSRQAITSIAAVLLNKTVSVYGESMIAAVTIATRVSALIYFLMIGFSQGFQPICAMNYGAKKYDRVDKAFRLTVIIGSCFMALGALVMFFMAGRLIGVFSGDSQVLEDGILLIKFQCLSLPFLAYYAVSSMYMQNIGRYLDSLIISVSKQGIFFIPLLFILPAICGKKGIYMLQPMADMFSFLLALLIIHRYRFTEKHILNGEIG